MQIQSIELEGLWAYREQQNIMLAGHPLVVGVGENGAGKSAILVHSVVAAFYAKFPTKTVQEAITSGASQGRVSVEFRINDTDYRVSRTFPRKGSASGQVLVKDQTTRSGWRDVTNKGAKEVNEYIINLLGMDYETATMTWIAEQGQYGKFSNALPSKRFDLLSGIFGLDIYAPKAKAAKAAAEAALLLVANADGKIAELSGSMDTADGADTGFGAMDDTQLADNLAAARADEDRYTQQLAELNTADPARQTVEARQAYELVRNERISRLTAATQTVERSELAIGHAKNRATAARATAKEQFERALGVAASRAEQAKARAAQARQDAARKKIAIVGAVRDLPDMVDEVNASREAAQDLRRDADLAAEQGAAHQAEYARLKAQAAGVKTSIAEAEERILLLGKSTHDEAAACFACGQHLSAADAQALIESQQRDITAWSAQVDALREEGGVARAAEQAAGELRAAKLAEAVKADAEADRLGGEVAKTQALVASQEQVDADEAAASEALKQASRDEESWRAEAADVHSAAIKAADADEVTTVTAAEAELVSAREVVAHTQEPSAQEGTLHADLLSAEAAVADTTAGFETRRQDVEGKRAAARENSTLYAAESRRRAEAAVLRADQNKRLGELRVERADAQRDVLVHQTLFKAFSPSGIPAMVLNTVVAELNEAVNVSLERLSRGEMRVELRTSRETVKGTPENKISVFVEVGSETHAYEALSGGQKFRVDLAIRAGLADAIAKGTGTPIRTFIVDEGWGTLDEKGVRSTIDTLFRLSEDTNVVTVSHIDSVRDAFPARVEVEMRGRSSVATLAA